MCKVLRDWEQQRLEAVGNKLRSQREQMEQRRKESQVKFTEKLPPVKRSRGCESDSVVLLIDLSSQRDIGVQTQRKTLFQKTRSDAVKMQKGIYGARIPVPPVKTTCIVKPPIMKMSSGPGSSTSTAIPTRVSGTRVTVNTIPQKPLTLSKTSAAAQTVLQSPPKPVSVTKHTSILPTAGHAAVKYPFTITPSTQSATHKPEVPPKAPPTVAVQPVMFKSAPAKKDPIANIFMPKHRSYSQLPTRTNGMRSRA